MKHARSLVAACSLLALFLCASCGASESASSANLPADWDIPDAQADAIAITRAPAPDGSDDKLPLTTQIAQYQLGPSAGSPTSPTSSITMQSAYWGPCGVTGFSGFSNWAGTDNVGSWSVGGEPQTLTLTNTSSVPEGVRATCVSWSNFHNNVQYIGIQVDFSVTTMQPGVTTDRQLWGNDSFCYISRHKGLLQDHPPSLDGDIDTYVGANSAWHMFATASRTTALQDGATCFSFPGHNSPSVTAYEASRASPRVQLPSIAQAFCSLDTLHGCFDGSGAFVYDPTSGVLTVSGVGSCWPHVVFKCIDFAL